MTDLVLTTYDWVPEPPRGYVRDLRIRWALEEAGLPYRVATTPFDGRGEEHLAHQPFAQVPWLTDGDLSIFESGAILLHLGERSETLMSSDARVRAEVKTWLFAALSSVEIITQPWSLLRFFADREAGPDDAFWNTFFHDRLTRLDGVLAARTWLAGPFSIADILMADVLRLPNRFDGLAAHPACRDYLARATARPAFMKAHADQLAHFTEADQARSVTPMPS